MHFLPIQNAILCDRSVAAEVRDCSESVGLDSVRGRPLLEHDRGQGADPGQAEGWHRARAMSDRLAKGDEVRVSVEVPVDAVVVPELVEARVEVEVDPERD